MSTLQNQSDEVQRLRQEDLYLFWLNPYVFTRALILTAWDIVVELGQALRQVLLDQRPRVSRLHKAYPVLRAVTNVFLRELSTYMVTLDVIRGAPAIYTTFVGYDEVAHHAGPDTPDAMGTLRAFDRSIRRVRDAIRDKAGRPYDLFLLSDHGQSAGATFLQRYGLTLAEFIETLAKVKTSGTTSNDTGQNFVAVLAQELKNTTARRPSKRADRVRQSAINRAGRSLQRRVERSPDAAQPVSTDAPVVVCAGGNMAHAYFNLHTGKVTLAELSAAYPGLLDALAEHEGIGFVVAFDDPAPGSDQVVPIVFGKRGARNLVTGVVAGDDPLKPYGDAEMRAGQLLYMAEFPNAGDLIINSTLYPDGQVAAFEELVGSHGGLGGQQTDAFLLHPADMAVPPTTNSIDLFALLDQRRGLPSPAAAPAATPALPDRRWAPGVLWAGLREWRVWMPRVAQAMALDSRVFSEVKRNRLMTGPALLISLVAFGLAAIGAARNDLILGSPMERGLIALVVLYMGWAMNVSLSTWVRRRTRKGESSTVSARVLGFALAPLVLLVFAFLPKIGPVVVIVAVLLDTLAFLIAMRSALHTPWTATLAIPIASLALTAVAVVAGWFMLGGIAIAFESLLKMLQRSP